MRESHFYSDDWVEAVRAFVAKQRRDTSGNPRGDANRPPSEPDVPKPSDPPQPPRPPRVDDPSPEPDAPRPVRDPPQRTGRSSA